MNKKTFLMFMLLIVILLSSAYAQGTESILEIKAAAPARWYAEIQTEEGNTVTVDAPVHIPDVDILNVHKPGPC